MNTFMPNFLHSFPSNCSPMRVLFKCREKMTNQQPNVGWAGGFGEEGKEEKT